MKIPFTLDAWLKDKSQRVETRDGRLVHNIWLVKEPSYTNNRKDEVCALIDGEEDALVFFEGGRYLPTTKDTDSPFDLFIVTPEPELSEFEKHLKQLLDFSVTLGSPYEIDCIKSEAAELLELAKDELTKQGNLILPIEAFEKRYVEAQEKGRKEALKDLPRWRKLNNIHEGLPYRSLVLYGMDDRKWEIADKGKQIGVLAMYIPIGDLKELPKDYSGELPGFNE